MQNQIVINIPEGKRAIQEIDKDGNIIIKYVDVFHSKSWDDFCMYHPDAVGDYTIENSQVKQADWPLSNCRSLCRNKGKSLLATKEDAEGILALIQLTRLHDEWVGDWKPDYTKVTNTNWHIHRKGSDDFIITNSGNYARVLSFPYQIMAQEFLECFKDLIEKARKFI